MERQQRGAECAGPMSLSPPSRILVVDGNARVSYGASFFRAFSALGQDAYFLDNAAWVGGWNYSLAARVARRLVNPFAVPAFNAYLLTQLACLRPDILFVPKGVGLRSRTIALARRFARACIVFQNDDMKNLSSTTPDMLRAIPLWDAVFTPRRFAVSELQAAGARRVEVLPFAYDPLLSFPPPESDRDPALAGAAVFVGTCMPERIAPLEALSARVPVLVFGGGWERVSSHSPLRRGLRSPVFDGQLRRIVASAGINVAFVAKANRDQHTMRTFEIPACGGFMLAERTPVHQELFREDEEAAFFGSTEELVTKAADYLGDAGRRRRIAEAGCRRVTGRERYEDRAAKVLELAREVLRIKTA
jgi:hypothetical protein